MTRIIRPLTTVYALLLAALFYGFAGLSQAIAILRRERDR